MLQALKTRLSRFLGWHVVNPILRQQRELLFQNLVDRDLTFAEVRNDLYPVGAAGGYGLLYILIRILRENKVDSIVEFGSGESTRLIDGLKKAGTYHVCYEDHNGWHEALRPRLRSCDYRLQPLRERTIAGVACSWYDAVEPLDFDLMLVDGPGGVDSFSRFGCWESITSNRKSDFVVLFDDCIRTGERETLTFVSQELAAKGLKVYVHYLESGNVPAILCCGRFAHLRFYI